MTLKSIILSYLQEDTRKKYKHDPNFDFDKEFGILVERDKTGEWIYSAGRDWKYFDFKKGLDALIKKDNTRLYIYQAGRDWKEFDFEKGFDALIKKDKIGSYIFHAGLGWEKFDYKKGFAQLKKISPNEWYKQAKEEWPLSAKETLDKISDELSKTPQRPSRKMKLENTEEEDYSKLSARQIYNKGKKDSNFDFEKGLGALIKKDEDGGYIYLAGMDWKQFDFEKGFDGLIKKDKKGNYIYDAGIDWEQFDYKKGFKHLKKISPDRWYREAKKDWPPSAKEALDKISNELKKTPQRPSRKMKL